MNVLVLDGNENQAVACVRSLARAGHRVIVGSDAAWSKAGWSRYAAGTFRYPAPQRDVASFVDALAAETARRSGGLIMPLTERTTLPLSEERDRVEAAGGIFVLPSRESVRRAFNKEETTRLASQLGVAVPATRVLEDAADATDFARGATYPIVLKPRASEEMTTEGVTRAAGAPAYVRSETELLAAFNVMRQRASAVLAQEFIEGQGAGYFALLRNGDLKMEFAHRRVRDVRPTGSGSALRESVAPHPRVRDASLEILRALCWHGVAMVEFRVRSDGVPVFMEVNGRFWNSLALPVFAGADFPAALAELAETGDVSPRPPYRLGVRCRWMLGDVRHLMAVWRGRPKGFTGAFPGRASTLRDFLTPVPGTFHDNFTVRDPLPELGDWLDFVFRRMPQALARR